MKTKTSKKKIQIPEIQIKEYKNKYRLTAEELYFLLGDGNFSGVYNCMTRFRAKIINKKIVNVEQIKKIPLVKGINWVGDELQVIIGGEVIKVTDEFKKFEQELQTPIAQTNKNEIVIKKTIWQKFLGFLSGVMGPAVPVLMIVGIMGAIYALLTLPEGNNLLKTKTIINGEEQSISLLNLYAFDIWSSLFFILNKVVLGGLGIFFIYNTTKYFKGNILFGLVVGLALMSRGFFPISGSGIGVPYDNAGFGDWTTAMNKTGFLLFKISDYPILVCGYEGAIIPYIVAGICVTYLDKWIKTWMPSVVDIVFRPFLVFFISMFGLWFIVAPLAGLFETGLGMLFALIGKIPYGFGVGLMAMFFQVIVLFGANWVVSMPMITELNQEHASAIYNALPIATWAQVGAVIGVAIITKNMTLKKVAWGTVSGGIFGITEPIIYGINVPKVRPFLFGCLGAGVGGFLSGILGVQIVRLAPFGIFVFLGYETTVKWILLGLLVNATAIIVALGLVLLFYSERKNEFAYFKKGINKLIKFINGDKTAINKEFEVYEKEIKSMKNDYKKIGKYYSEISKYEQQMISIEDKESKHRVKMYNQLVKLKRKLMAKESQELLNKFNRLNEQYSNYSLDQQKDEIQTKLNKIVNDNKEMLDKFNKEKETIYKNALKIVNLHATKDNATELLTVQNMMWNALNSVEVGFEIEDAKPIKFKKEMK